MDTMKLRATFDYIRRDNQLMYSVVLLDTETKDELTLLCKAKNNKVPSWVGMKQGQVTGYRFLFNRKQVIRFQKDIHPGFGRRNMTGNHKQTENQQGDDHQINVSSFHMLLSPSVYNNKSSLLYYLEKLQTSK